MTKASFADSSALAMLTKAQPERSRPASASGAARTSADGGSAEKRRANCGDCATSKAAAAAGAAAEAAASPYSAVALPASSRMAGTTGA